MYARKKYDTYPTKSQNMHKWHGRESGTNCTALRGAARVQRMDVCKLLRKHRERNDSYRSQEGVATP